MSDGKPALAPHVEQAVESIAKIHRAHHRESSRMERLTDAATANVGRPLFLVVLAGFIALWIGAEKVLPGLGMGLDDPYPYPLLGLTLTAAAIAIAVLILASQRRADRLGLLREQMTLELALLTEHKSSKIIQLIEELRRDLPDVSNRRDVEAAEMSQKPDHDTVLSVIDEEANKKSDA